MAINMGIFDISRRNEEKAFSELTYNERMMLSNRVSVAINMQYMDKLKELLPTAEDLADFRPMNGDASVLHMVLKARETPTAQAKQSDFLKQIFDEYKLDDVPEIKKELLLKRGANDKLAADFSYILEYASPAIKGYFEKVITGRTIPINEDTRTDFEKDKVVIYNFLKDEIKKVQDEPTRDDIHTSTITVGHKEDEAWNPYDKGVAVTSGMYLYDKYGNPAFYIRDSIKETYPEIRLRNIGDEENKEQACVLRNLDPDKPLLRQAVNKIDFPEDFVSQHFAALQVYERQYQEIRKDKGAFASYRFFNENNGIVVFEDKRDPEHVGNSNSGGDYGGYAGSSINGPLIVIRSDYSENMDRDGWTLLHELYHRVDLENGLTYSSTDMVKYALMLSQKDNNNTYKAFDSVDYGYQPSQYEKEMVAQVMSQPTYEEFEIQPLLKSMYNIGHKLAQAKADDMPAVGNRIANMFNDMPELNELSEMYQSFMDIKKANHNERMGISDQTERMDKFYQQRASEREENLKDEEKRLRLEKALLERMQGLEKTLDRIMENPNTAGKVVLSDFAMKQEFGGKLPEEIASELKGKATPEKMVEIATKLAKSQPDSPEYRENMFNLSCVAGELWRQNFRTDKHLPNNLPQLMNLSEDDFKRNPNETAKAAMFMAIALRQKEDLAITKLATEKMRYSYTLSNKDRLNGYINVARCSTGEVKYDAKMGAFRCLEEECLKHGCNKEDVAKLISKLNNQSKDIDVFGRIKETMPLIDDRLKGEHMLKLLDKCGNRMLNDKLCFDSNKRYLDKLSEVEKFGEKPVYILSSNKPPRIATNDEKNIMLKQMQEHQQN